MGAYRDLGILMDAYRDTRSRMRIIFEFLFDRNAFFFRAAMERRFRYPAGGGL